MFGVSWNPPEPERKIAEETIAFLEDRRVLYNLYELEVLDHCVRSVIEIRQFLTSSISRKAGKQQLDGHLRAMRAACRKFLDTVQEQDRPRLILHRAFDGGPAVWSFFTALGDLRTTFGLHIAMIAVEFGIPVEDELASILPPKPSAND